MLRIVTMYPGLCEHQLLCFHPGKEDTTRPCSLIWRGRAAFFKQTAVVISWQGKHQKLTMRLSGQCGSLLDFIRQVDYHAPADFPVKLVFFADGDYMILLILPPGRRHLSAMLCGATKGEPPYHAGRYSGANRPNRLSGLSGFCTVDEEGQTNYFKKAGGT